MYIYEACLIRQINILSDSGIYRYYLYYNGLKYFIFLFSITASLAKIILDCHHRLYLDESKVYATAQDTVSTA